MRIDLKYIGIDCGGTNLRVYEIDPISGKVIRDLIEDPIELKKLTANKELTDIILGSTKNYGKALIGFGCTSAGAIDEKSLIINNSPNSSIKGQITFARDLKEKGHIVSITNDMRAAVKGAVKYGQGKGLNDVLMVTYSSGYNDAKAKDGEIITEDEFGHMPYKPGCGLFCGCGGEGHLEIFVSGNGAASMAKQYFLMTKAKEHPILKYSLGIDESKGQEYPRKSMENNMFWLETLDSITAKQVYKAYRENPKQNPQKRIKEIQTQAIADSFGMMTSAHNPLDIIICMGSQTKDWDLLFEPAIKSFEENPEQYHLPGIKSPKIVRNNDDLIGVKGAVAYLIDKLESIKLFGAK
jgi:predicted NBD/HSP70 family sugar kinase